MRAIEKLLRLRLVRELAGYTVATGAAFVVDFGLFTVLVTLLTIPYLVAAAISFTVGTMLAYWATTRYVFAFRRIGDARKEFSAFLFIGGVGLAVNLLVVYCAVEFLRLHPLLAKLGAGAVTFLANFALRRFVLFTPWRETSTPAEIDSCVSEQRMVDAASKPGSKE